MKDLSISLKYIFSGIDKKSKVEEAYLILDPEDLLVNFINIHGDEEACRLNEYKNVKRSTGDFKDLTRLYIYDGSNDLHSIIRIEYAELVYRHDDKLTVLKLTSTEMKMFMDLLKRFY